MSSTAAIGLMHLGKPVSFFRRTYCPGASV